MNASTGLRRGAKWGSDHAGEWREEWAEVAPGRYRLDGHNAQAPCWFIYIYIYTFATASMAIAPRSLLLSLLLLKNINATTTTTAAATTITPISRRATPPPWSALGSACCDVLFADGLAGGGEVGEEGGASVVDADAVSGPNNVSLRLNIDVTVSCGRVVFGRGTSGGRSGACTPTGRRGAPRCSRRRRSPWL